MGLEGTVVFRVAVAAERYRQVFKHAVFQLEALSQTEIVQQGGDMRGIRRNGQIFLVENQPPTRFRKAWLATGRHRQTPLVDRLNRLAVGPQRIEHDVADGDDAWNIHDHADHVGEPDFAAQFGGGQLLVVDEPVDQRRPFEDFRNAPQRTIGPPALAHFSQ